MAKVLVRLNNSLVGWGHAGDVLELEKDDLVSNMIDLEHVTVVTKTDIKDTTAFVPAGPDATNTGPTVVAKATTGNADLAKS